MSRYIDMLHLEVETIERIRSEPKRKEMTIRFQRQKAAEVTAILAGMDVILKRHMVEYISILVLDKGEVANTVRGSSSYQAEKMWKDLVGYVGQPILPGDIAGFKDKRVIP